MMFLRTLATSLILVVACGVYADDGEHNPDPLEAINRPIFAFNNTLDKYLLRPVAKGYDFVVPDIAQQGVGNFFTNLFDVTSTVNSALQWRWDGVAHGTGRFLVNSTIGVLGLFDVATPLGLEQHPADFGQTLAVWGLDAGPYIMVPVLGPRTLRSGAGTVADSFTYLPNYSDNVPLRNSLTGLSVVDARAQLLNAEDLISGDRYIFVRDAYLQQRESFVNGGVVEDNFSDFEDDDWGEEF